LGTQQTPFDGKKRHQIRLAWEFSDEKMKDGRPFSISKTYTWSMHKRAALRGHLEAWRGLPFTDKDFGPTGFNIRNILGKSCLLTVTQERDNKDELYSFVSNVGKLMKGQTGKPPINACIYLWLTLDLWDPKVYELLHERTRETIAKSPEYQAIATGRPMTTQPEPAPDLSDDIPF
jgi:hypothetical protein